MEKLVPDAGKVSKPTVALLGDINMDVFLRISAYPPKGGDGMADKVVVETGGSVANTAIQLVRLGASARIIAQVGEDVWSRMALESLRQEGVQLDLVQSSSEESTGLTFVTVTPDGERTMFTFGGANRKLQAEVVTLEALHNASYLHLSGYAFLLAPQSQAAWRAAEVASELGIPISLDLGVGPANALGEDLQDLLKRLDLLVLGPEEAKAVCKCDSLEQSIKEILSYGTKRIGLKLGANGCRLISPEHAVDLPGFLVNVVDTTGAGDAFCAGLIFGLTHGLSLPACGLLANAVGALTTTRWGAGTSVAQRSELIDLLNQSVDLKKPFQSNIHEILTVLQT